MILHDRVQIKNQSGVVLRDDWPAQVGAPKQGTQNLGEGRLIDYTMLVVIMKPIDGLSEANVINWRGTDYPIYYPPTYAMKRGKVHHVSCVLRVTTPASNPSW